MAKEEALEHVGRLEHVNVQTGREHARCTCEWQYGEGVLVCSIKD